MTAHILPRGRSLPSRAALAGLAVLAALAPCRSLTAQKAPAAPAAPAATPAASKPDTVRLRFDWPVGMTADVEQVWVRTRTTEARTDSVRMPSTYRLQVLAHPKGRLVRTDRFAIAPAAAGAGGEQEAIQRLSASIGGMQPSYVVSHTGEFLQVEDVARMKAALDSMVAPLLKDIANAPPQLRSFMATLTSEEALAASAAQEWNAVAGTWVGVDWELGEVYESRVEEPIAILPGLTVPVVYHFSATERVPCEDGAPADGCIALEMRSSPDSAGMRTLMERLMRELAGDQGREVAAMLGGMRVENELSVVAEARTLRPYSVVRVRRSVVEARQGVTGRMEQEDVRMARFRYAAGAGK